MNLHLKRTTDVIAVAVAAVVFTLILPWIIGVGMGSDPDIDVRKEQIEKMSADARQRLEANLVAFEKAPQYLRDEFRALNEAIERDSELAEMLNEYCSWIQSLPPEQQEKLRKPDEPNDRIRLVMRYLHQIPPPPSDRHPSDRGPQLQHNWAASWMRYVHLVVKYVEREDRLSNEELAAVISILEGRNTRNVDRPSRGAANSKSLWQRGIAVLDELARRNRPQDQEQRQEFRRLSERVIQEIETPSVAKNLRELKASPMQFQQALRQVVVCTLLNLLIDDLTRDVSPMEFPPELHEHDFDLRGLSEEQRRKRLALFYRLTRGQAGYEAQIAAFRRLIPKNYLGRERLADEGFPNQPGGRSRPRPDGGPPPHFGGTFDQNGRNPPRPPRDGEGRPPPSPRRGPP